MIHRRPRGRRLVVISSRIDFSICYSHCFKLFTVNDIFIIFGVSAIDTAY